MRKLLFIAALLCTTLFANAQKIGQIQPSAKKLIDEGITFYDVEKYQEALEAFNKVTVGDTLYELACYEKALTYVALKEYEKALNSLNEGFLFSYGAVHDLYLLKGNTFDDMNQPDSSIKTYEEALKIFPLSTRLYGEMFATYANQKDYDKAITALEKAFFLSPTYVTHHVRYGLAAAQNGNYALSLLALNTALMLNKGNSERSNGILSIMDQIAGNKYEKSEDYIDFKLKNIEDFETLDQVIVSGVALKSDFKYQFKKANFTIFRQMQIIVENLPSSLSDKDDVLSNFYTNLYREIQKNGHFVGSQLYTVSDLDLKPELASEIKKNAKKIEAFKSFFGTYLNDYWQKSVKVLPNNEKVVGKIIHSFRTIEGFGEINSASEKTGPWKFYDDDFGYLLSTGVFKNGKKEGLWTYYHPNGLVKDKVEFKNDTENGIYESYNALGNLVFKTVAKNGKIADKSFTYYHNGSQKEELTFKDGERNGPRKSFYKSGELNVEYSEKDGKGEGAFVAYHQKGKVRIKGSLKNDDFEGEYLNFYSDGSKREVSYYKNGKLDSNYIEYYQNGKIASEGKYKNGEKTGAWKYYYLSGVLYNVENWLNSEQEGEDIFYDTTGVVFEKTYFSKGKLQKLEWYNAKGELEKTFKPEGKKFYVERRNKFRVLSSSGNITDGERDGVWKSYYYTGAVKVETTYKKNKMEGLEKSFYSDGTIESEGYYTDNELNGYFKTYYLNGKNKVEGFYKEGEKTGNWKYFDINGNLTSITGYDPEFGIMYEVRFYLNGKKETEFFYRGGNFYQTISYDTLGNIINHNLLTTGNEKVNYVYPNGKIYTTVQYKNSSRTGKQEVFYINGSTQSIFYYKNGILDGPYKSFFEDGKPYITGFYKDGNQDSTWTYYYPSGKVRRISKYKDDAKDGKEYIYDENGAVLIESDYVNGSDQGYTHYYVNGNKLALRLKYEAGFKVSYSYLDKSGNFVPEIKIKQGLDTVVAYFQNGQKSIEFNLNYDSFVGFYNSYYFDGKPFKKRNFKNDEEHGLQQIYHPNGNLASEYEASYGEQHGLVKTYHLNGKLKQESNFVYDMKNGVEKTYDANGKLIKTQNYIYDKGM